MAIVSCSRECHVDTSIIELGPPLLPPHSRRGDMPLMRRATVDPVVNLRRQDEYIQYYFYVAVASGEVGGGEGGR